MSTISGLPELFGSPLRVSAKPTLTAYRGKLLSTDQSERGKPVHAASFLRRREVVLESQLLSKRSELRLILTHEIFHFVWMRLGNQARSEFRALLELELEAGARGELGESAQVNKAVLLEKPNASCLRNYVSESFCDSGAWLFAGVKNSRHWTLAHRWRSHRRRWFASTFYRPRAC